MQATIRFFNGDHAHVVSGPIHRRYPNGLSIVGPRELILYASTAHVLHDPATVAAAPSRKDTQGYLL